MTKTTRKCRSCTRVAVEGYSQCEYHKEYNRRYTAEVHAKQRELGLCYQCGVNEVVPGIRRCAGCQQAHNEYARKRRRAAAAGTTICIRCACRKRYKGRTMCHRCLKRGRDAARDKRIEKKIGVPL